LVAGPRLIIERRNPTASSILARPTNFQQGNIMIGSDIDDLVGEGEPAERFAGHVLVWPEMAVRLAVLRGYRAGLIRAMRDDYPKLVSDTGAELNLSQSDDVWAHDDLVYALNSGILITHRCRSEAVDRLNRYQELLTRAIPQLDERWLDESQLLIDIKEAIK
jgi:hypothetical protein